jgi:mono/diheme cytochrome c family protein
MSQWVLRSRHIAAITLGAAVFAAAGGTPARDQADEAGFQSSVQPFLARNCSGCHNSKLQFGGLNLPLYTGTDAVAKDREHWQLILDRIRTGQMPPAGMPRPPEDALKSVTAWISTEFDREDRLVKPDPGHVTARRLNRTEYNNSVRDLLGVNFDPAADFPPDDSGYGFDNIGDVLSMSPSLMEKYLSAAEKVARMALYGPPTMKPTLVKHEPWYVDFDNTRGVKTDYDLTGISLPSALHVMHRFPVEGDYDVAGLLRGNRPPGSEPLQVAFWIDGKQVATLPYPVPGGGEVSGQRKEFRVHVTSGEHWMSASILKIYEGLPVSFHGPNPSKLPPPPSRGKRGPAAAAPTNDEVPAADPNAVFSGGAAVGFFVSNLEVTGPHNQVSGPSESSRKRIFVCATQTTDCAHRIVSSLAARVYRRPPTQQEIAQLTGLVATAQKNGDSFQEGLCLAIQRMLISPSFLFLVEQDRKSQSTAASRPVSEYELASRLSYFIWGSTPDDQLLRLAGEQKLRKPDVLNAQVNRMLRDAKAQSLVDDFGGQWLQFRALESHEPERKKFQQYTEYTRMSMAKETQLFFANMMQQDRPITDFLDAKYTFLNQRLAEFYGIPDVKGAEFRKVDLSGTKREGVLTQASVLTVSSYANRTSPVIRGKWILENILNSPPPPPPNGVSDLDESAVGTSASLREQLEKHRANAVCASCHSRMDPLGFALENYDAIGQWRVKDGKFPIDATGQLPDGRKFEGATGLADILMSNPDAFAQAVTEKMLTYALGRGLEPFDRIAVKKIVGGMAANQYRFSSLVLGVVNSLPFQERRSIQNVRDTQAP